MNTMTIVCAAVLLVLSIPLLAGPPEPIGPVPSARQLAWHDLEYYAFVHFNMNTFTDREWGTGAESPETFNPTQLDCRQWARVCRDAGMKGIIITAKHHDGFCLWPSELTDHSVASSRWRDGKGDLLRELSEACTEFGLKFGIYMSPWDRNCSVYGDSPRYNEYFKEQLTDVLTNYGEVFEVWFDGANGEGPNGKRQVYDWEGFIETVRAHQPNAVIFSDAGPDVRWVGNERGYAGETNWSLLRRDEFVPGTPLYRQLTEGHADGTHWLPAECNTSIRPGWYYHAAQDDQVKSLEHLLDIYYSSVGRNGSFLLNLPVDRRGLVHENDVERLMELRAALDSIFETDVARRAAARASSVREGDPRYGANGVINGDDATYWATDDGVVSGSIEIEFERPTIMNHLLVEEFIELGQRVEAFSVEVLLDGVWSEVARGTTVGHRRIVRFPTVTAPRIRLNVERARACPTISRISVYAAPPTVTIKAPSAAYVGGTIVTIKSDYPDAKIRYTLDGSVPDLKSMLYTEPIELSRSAVVSAIAISDGRASIHPASVTLTRYAAEDLRHPLVFVRAPDPGIRFTYYEGGWQSLTDIEHAEPVGEGVVGTISLDPRERNEHFAIRFDGLINVPSDGIYTFHLTSDDGSRLYIGDDLVIDNDGLHGMEEKTGVAALRDGFHPISVEYFNATGGMGLEVSVEGPGIERQALPQSWLHR